MAPVRWGKGPRFTSPRFNGGLFMPSASDTVEFGNIAATGPFGSGKTLLFAHLSYQHSKRGVCKGRWCPNPDCEEVWKVYTNLTTHPDRWGVQWAEHLDYANLMSDGTVPDHATVLLDEPYRFLDSRRSSSSVNVEMASNLMQVRKDSLIVLLSLPSIDDLDRRVRDQLLTVYNVWTPNKGVTTYAVVHHLAQGNVPPWARRKGRPVIRKWHTESTRGLYETGEKIGAFSIGKKTTVDIRQWDEDDQDYFVVSSSHERLVDVILADAVKAGTYGGTVKWIVAAIAERYNVKVDDSTVHRHLRTARNLEPNADGDYYFGGGV